MEMCVIYPSVEDFFYNVVGAAFLNIRKLASILPCAWANLFLYQALYLIPPKFLFFITVYIRYCTIHDCTKYILVHSTEDIWGPAWRGYAPTPIPYLCQLHRSGRELLSTKRRSYIYSWEKYLGMHSGLLSPCCWVARTHCSIIAFFRCSSVCVHCKMVVVKLKHVFLR